MLTNGVTEMIDNRRPRPTGSPLSQAMGQKVHPIAIAGATTFIVGFLLLVIVVQQFPENWFVQKYLRGYRGVIAGFLFWCAVMGTMAFVESVAKRRRTGANSDS